MARTPENDVAQYLLNGIPGELWDRAKAKAAAARPPISMRWVLIQGLEAFAPGPYSVGLAPQPARKTVVKAPRQPIPKETRKRQPVQAPAEGDLPDLSTAF